MLTRFRSILCAVAVLGGFASSAIAQTLVPLHRHKLGLSGTMVSPTGEFRQFVEWGGGVGMYFVPGLDAHGTVGIRVDGSAQWYGHESYDVWLGPRVPNGYARVTTSNMIFTVGAGPQITLGSGRARPYGFGTAGFSYFATISSVGNTEYEYDSNTNFDDMRFALTAGGGLLVQLNRGHRPVWLDLGGQWTHNGRTRYLRTDGIVETADGGLLLFPIYSDADFWMFRMGLAFAL
jgi:hypothetical protein